MADFLSKIYKKGQEHGLPDDEPVEEDKEYLMSGYRRTMVHEAALENCALKHAEMLECMRSGGIMERMTMCWERREKFWKCVKSQKAILSELGYALPSHSAKENEDILNKADSMQ